MTNSNAFLFQPDPVRSAAQESYQARMAQSQGEVWPVLPQGEPCPPEARMSRVRFLNAAPGLRLCVAAGRQTLCSALDYQGLSGYQDIAGGFHPLVVSSPEAPRSVYLRQSIPFVPGEIVTYVLLPHRGRLRLVRVPDALCLSGPEGSSCLRMANFCPRTGPLELLTEEGEQVFTGVLFQETTAFRSIRPGDYLLCVGEEGLCPAPLPQGVEGLPDPFPADSAPLTTFTLSVRPASAYTVFVLDSGSILIAEDAAQSL